MKIFPLADYASDWYPKNAIELFKKYSHATFVNTPQQADLIWIFSYYAAGHIYALPPALYSYLPLRPRRKRIYQHKPVVTTIHHLTPEKKAQWETRVMLLDHVTDTWQTFSHINYNYFKKIFKKPIRLLPYWIDTTIFTSVTMSGRQALRGHYDLPQTKKIYGSFQRDTEADRQSPKLEKGPDIFCDIIEQLNPTETFVLLAGPHRDYIERRLAQKNIQFKSLGKTPYSQMNDLYNVLDYYLVTSRYEGGPQAILECMATKTKLYSTPVGIADILSSQVVFTTAAAAAAMLRAPYPEVLRTHQETVRALDCQKVVPQYEQFFEEMVRMHYGQ